MLVAAAVAVPVSGQNLFHLDFSGNCQSLINGSLNSRHINEWDLIARCAGEAGLRTNNIGTNQQFDLAYNADADSIQVIRLADASAVCDVFQFQGGIRNDDGAHKARMAYVFVPEETQSVGTVILKERDRNSRNRLTLHGQIQFVLASLEVGSEGNGTNSTNAATIAGASAIGLSTPVSPGVLASSGSTSTSSGTTASATGTSITTPVSTSTTTTTTGSSTGTAATPPLPPGLPGSTGTSCITGTTSGTTSGTTNTGVASSDTNSLTAPVTGSPNSSGDLALPGSATVVATNSTLPDLTTTNTAVTTNPVLSAPADSGLALTTATNTSLPNLASATNGISLSTTNAVTNEVSGLSFTNGVICSGTFTASRRIRVTAQ